MAFLKIPVNVPFWSNIEDESRSVVAEQRRDVIKDVLGSTIKRPCLSEFATGLPAAADGMYFWLNAGLVYIVSNGSLYSLSEAGVLTLVQAAIFSTGALSGHVTWAESTDLTLVTVGAVRKLFAANSAKIVEYDLATAQVLADADAPTQVTHIIMFDTYLQANDLSDPKWDETVQRAKVADPISWDGAFYSAENHPDKLKAIHTAWDEIALFGEAQIENFFNDRSSPFSAIPGGNVNDGTLSPWTIKNDTTAWYYLNTNRNLIRLIGRQPAEVSHPIDDILDGDVDYANAEGEFFTLKGKFLYLLTINDRTFVYDTKFNEWVGEWGFWNTTTATYAKFKGRNFINVKPWGVTLCTDKDTGTIYKLDFDTYQDDGNEVRSSVITGEVDHGTGREKRSNELRIRLKRGQKDKIADSTVAPVMLIRWRDNGSKVWSNFRTIDLGFKGDGEFYRSLFQLGSYRARQYEFVVTDNVPFSIVEVEEDVELLR